MNWLIKEEPTNYSFDDLLRDGRTAWWCAQSRRAETSSINA